MQTIISRRSLTGSSGQLQRLLVHLQALTFERRSVRQKRVNRHLICVNFRAMNCPTMPEGQNSGFNYQYYSGGIPYYSYSIMGPKTPTNGSRSMRNPKNCCPKGNLSPQASQAPAPQPEQRINKCFQRTKRINNMPANRTELATANRSRCMLHHLHCSMESLFLKP